MDADDILAHDQVAKQWIEEIDSFKSPPPPRRLADLNGLASGAEDHQRQGNGGGGGGDLSTPFSSAQHSRDGSYSTDPGGHYRSLNNDGSGRMMNGESEEMPQDNFIVEKVRQFEDNDAHPYASHRRVETSKKIAAHGGNLAAFLVNDKGKQRISKEEASKLRATVLQENRVYNPYPNPYSNSVSTNKNGGGGGGSNASRRTDPSNSSGGSGSSSLISQTRDSSSSSTAGVGAPGANGEGTTVAESASNRQQQHPRPQQLALQRRLQAQRPFNNPSAIAVTAAMAGTNSTISSQGPTPLSSPSTTISSSALMSPRDDRSTVSSVTGQHQNDRKIYEAPSTRTAMNGSKVITNGVTALSSTKLSNNAAAAKEEIYKTTGDKRPSTRTPAATMPKLPESSAPPAETPNSVEDEEMASIYRIFDAEVKMFGNGRQPPPPPQEPNVSNGRVSNTPMDSQQATSFGLQKKRTLPPYTGIRQQTSRSAHSESPVPAAALPPPPPRGVFSPPVTTQQRYQQLENRRSLSGSSGRVPVPPPPPPPASVSSQAPPMPPPLPVRQPPRSRQQQHYDVPAALRRPPSGANYFSNDYGSVKSRPFASAVSFDNGFQRQNGSVPDRGSVMVPPPPPPPPPPPASQHATRRHYGATPIIDRIPAHEMAITTSTTPVIMRRSASHTTGTTWNRAQYDGEEQRGSVAMKRSSHYAGNGGVQNEHGHDGHTSSVPPPPPVRQYQQRANSFSGALDRSAANGLADNAAVERQQRMWNDLERQVVDDLEKKAVPIGLCHQCGAKVTNPLDATQALGHLYHAQCFTCCYCGRALKGKKFYEARGKVYCEEDYLYSGFQHSAEQCAACGHLIMDMILQAVGKSFHPNCFKCHECRRGLENVPFTVDDQGLVYCIDDYHRLFAPRCAKCRQPITPTQGREETVRVVAMQRDYHIDCYACEGCGLRLTDEDEKRCYPLDDHLLCQRCHLHWSRTGGASHPITDL